ncbi:phage tail protein [Pantoea deleyi]|uniref:phage tail protein n=1 Tax=Pantoea deleyi TaxID=470932 RepID=UPI0035D52736
MTTKYFALLTNQGAAKLANAAALGSKVNITSLGVGDGGGTLPTPDAAQTKLIGEKRRAQLNSLTVDAANSSQIIAEQIIPESEGGFWIREIGLYDADGVLIAVANCPETYKPQLAEGSGRTQTVRMILIVNSTTAVTLKIDPSVVLATRKYVDDAVIEVKAYADSVMKTHTDAKNPHSQYLQIANALAEIKDAGLIEEALKSLGLMSAAQRAVGAGSKQIPDMSFFGMSAASPGYQILPGGIVLQWGIAAVPVAGSVNIKYPVAIGLGLAQFSSPVDGSSTNNYRVGVATSDKTSITLTSTNTSSVTGVMWLSIGKMNQ